MNASFTDFECEMTGQFSDFYDSLDADPARRGKQFEHFVKWFLKATRRLTRWTPLLPTDLNVIRGVLKRVGEWRD